MNNKIKIVSLGCDKNLVDSELLSTGLVKEGFLISPDYTEGIAVIVNTCGFIDAAREESIETILAAIEQKKEHKFKFVYVMGCLSQRYREDLKKELPDADGIFGIDEFSLILEKIAKDTHHQLKTNPNNIDYSNRIALGSQHYAYIRISDGCNHNCSYCSIPLMRGKHRSRTMESIYDEVKTLRKSGVKEFILIGQEINSYGVDIYKKSKICELSEELSKLAGKDNWIRLMYSYPPLVDNKFIETIAKYDNICNYLDFPIQHCDKDILKTMNRPDSIKTLTEKITYMRQLMPDFTLRTSIITGLPGESRHKFNELLKFIDKIEFERLGCFAYSPEEDTPAVLMPNRVTKTTAIKRVGEIMNLQQEISYEKNRALIGTTQKVLIDRIEGENSIGRTFRDAPEIDNEVLIKANLEVGEFYSIKIMDAYEFDLIGEVIK